MLAQVRVGLAAARSQNHLSHPIQPGTPMKLQQSEFDSLAGHESYVAAFCNILPCKLQNTGPIPGFLIMPFFTDALF